MQFSGPKGSQNNHGTFLCAEWSEISSYRSNIVPGEVNEEADKLAKLGLIKEALLILNSQWIDIFQLMFIVFGFPKKVWGKLILRYCSIYFNEVFVTFSKKERRMLLVGL